MVDALLHSLLREKIHPYFFENLAEALRYKKLDKSHVNAEFASKRNSKDYSIFESTVFCKASIIIWIESVNY